MRCSAICTVRSDCWPTARCRRNCRSGTRIFSGPATAFPPSGNRSARLCRRHFARRRTARWWALADRTQTPSGPGYALENRQIVSRVFPDLLSDLAVRSLGGFFAAMRENLLRHSPDGEPPLAVVLTPGSFNETYFEHAYLARQLGLPLVEGNDLTVRGGYRVPEDTGRAAPGACDFPQAGRRLLRSGRAAGGFGARRARAHFGGAGRQGAHRQRPGQRGARIGGVDGFHPAAAQRLLGEPLRLASVATWWCGEKPALDYVVENIARLVVKPAFPNQRFEPAFGRDLQPGERASLVERIMPGRMPTWRRSPWHSPRRPCGAAGPRRSSRRAPSGSAYTRSRRPPAIK